MGVYINMEMPTNCSKCLLGDGYACYVTDKNVEDQSLKSGRSSFCPLVLVPPHGDLIERDALACISWKAGEVEDSFDAGVLFVLDHADELPTIIPAEGTGEPGTNKEET